MGFIYLSLPWIPASGAKAYIYRQQVVTYSQFVPNKKTSVEFESENSPSWKCIHCFCLVFLCLNCYIHIYIYRFYLFIHLFTFGDGGGGGGGGWGWVRFGTISDWTWIYNWKSECNVIADFIISMLLSSSFDVVSEHTECKYRLWIMSKYTEIHATFIYSSMEWHMFSSW